MKEIKTENGGIKPNTPRGRWARGMYWLTEVRFGSGEQETAVQCLL